MQADDMAMYLERMVDIKSRINVCNHLIAFPQELSRDACIESLYLQYRKILEQIAFASLISNREKFSKAYAKFSKYWNASELLKDLGKVNGHFYPEPVTERENPSPGVRAHITAKSRGYLTKSQFLELYGRTGDILHERNPYASLGDKAWFFENAGRWLLRIVALLDKHVLHLYGNENIYLIHMQGFEEPVAHYTLTPEEGIPTGA